MDEKRRSILGKVAEFAAELVRPQKFVPGVTPIPASGKVYGARELQFLVDSALDFWLTSGRYNEAFEKKLAAFLGVRHVLTANSGSSANLLALAALTSAELGDRALKAGDEIISVAAGFPTTVNPALLYGLTPVFMDVDIPTYNIQADNIEAAITPKTKAIMVAHTLGNPFDLSQVKALADKYRLWLVEDCCDALGSEYLGRHCGTFGDIATVSFYPAHHITMGEGGAVMTQQPKLKKIMESIRDWGRDCWCAPGKENTCGKRFEWQLGALPEGFDHKYTYSHLGYNLKITDMQAAVGLAQLDSLPEFISRRRKNFNYLKSALGPLSDRLILPEATPGSDPSWFGFPITVRGNHSFGRLDLIKHLDERAIGTRLMFGGNLTRQPYFMQQRYRIASGLENTDRIVRDTFWIGVYPGLTEEMLAYVAEVIAAFVRKQRVPVV